MLGKGCFERIIQQGEFSVQVSYLEWDGALARSIVLWASVVSD